jgi:hypothetical protein
MRFILSVLFIGILNIHAQEHSFLIQNNEIAWQKVYETKISFADIQKICIQTGMLVSLNSTENTIIGALKPIKIISDKPMTTAMYITYYDYTGQLTIEFKDGRYRINLQKIEGVQNMEVPNVAMQKTISLNEYAIKNGSMRKQFNTKDALIFENTFAKIFNFQAVKLNEW